MRDFLIPSRTEIDGTDATPKEKCDQKEMDLTMREFMSGTELIHDLDKLVAPSTTTATTVTFP